MDNRLYTNAQKKSAFSDQKNIKGKRFYKQKSRKRQGKLGGIVQLQHYLSKRNIFSEVIDCNKHNRKQSQSSSCLSGNKYDTKRNIPL